MLALTLDADTPYPLVGGALAAVGLGAGIFFTPNTALIMEGVPAGARGVANGVRSMLQNAGFVIGTALSLAIVTHPLREDDRRAAYEGRLSDLPGADLARFVDAYRTALLVLSALCLCAALACAAQRLLRGTRDGVGAGRPA